MNTVLGALDAIYDAALDPDLWPAALQKIADCFDDVGAVLMVQRDDGSFSYAVSQSLVAAHRDYDLNWREKDLRTWRGIERGYGARTDAVTDRHVATADEIETHPIYTVFLAKHGLKWFAAATVLPRPKNPVLISVQRRMTKSCFTDEDLDLLLRLGRHAENALRLGIRLLNAEAFSQGLMRLFSAMDYGVLLLDGAGTVVFRTPKAAQAMAEGLSLRAAGLQHGLPRQRHAAGVLDTGTTADVTPILVERPEGRPFVLYRLPVSEDTASASFAMLGDVRTIVVVLDMATHPALDPALLRDLFGLTLAEARVTALVGTGITAQHTAVQLGVAENTVRKALKSVFAKTGVNRQTELALLLSRLSLI